MRFCRPITAIGATLLLVIQPLQPVFAALPDRAPLDVSIYSRFTQEALSSAVVYERAPLIHSRSMLKATRSSRYARPRGVHRGDADVAPMTMAPGVGEKLHVS